MLEGTENEELRLLHEIHGGLDAVAQGLDDFTDKIDRNHRSMIERFDVLQQAMVSNSVLGQYTAAKVKRRLSAIETRLTDLEKRS